MLLRLSDYSQFLDKNNASLNTKSSYLRDIDIFKRWVDENVEAAELFDISGIIVGEYLAFLEKNGLSASTISRKATSLRKYFAWAFERGFIFTNPAGHIKAPKVIKRKPEAAETADILRLISTVNKKDVKGMRDIAMLRMLLSTGISVSELVSLKLCDVDTEKPVIYAGKGRKKRALKPDRKTLAALKAYISEVRPGLSGDKKNKNSHDDALFLSLEGRSLSRQGLWKIMKGYCLKAGITEKLSPKSIRHRFAVNALNRGEDVALVKKRLGYVTDTQVLEYKALLKQ